MNRKGDKPILIKFKVNNISTNSGYLQFLILFKSLLNSDFHIFTSTAGVRVSKHSVKFFAVDYFVRLYYCIRYIDMSIWGNYGNEKRRSSRAIGIPVYFKCNFF